MGIKLKQGVSHAEFSDMLALAQVAVEATLVTVRLSRWW